VGPRPAWNAAPHVRPSAPPRRRRPPPRGAGSAERSGDASAASDGRPGRRRTTSIPTGRRRGSRRRTRRRRRRLEHEDVAEVVPEAGFGGLRRRSTEEQRRGEERRLAVHGSSRCGPRRAGWLGRSLTSERRTAPARPRRTARDGARAPPPPSRPTSAPRSSRRTRRRGGRCRRRRRGSRPRGRMLRSDRPRASSSPVRPTVRRRSGSPAGRRERRFLLQGDRASSRRGGPASRRDGGAGGRSDQLRKSSQRPDLRAPPPRRAGLRLESAAIGGVLRDGSAVAAADAREAVHRRAAPEDLPERVDDEGRRPGTRRLGLDRGGQLRAGVRNVASCPPFRSGAAPARGPPATVTPPGSTGAASRP